MDDFNSYATVWERNTSLVLLSLCVLSSMWILGLDIGPYSLRVYLLLILTVLMIVDIFKRKKELFGSQYSKHLLLTYSVLVGWIFWVEFIRGAEPFNLSVRILSTHFIAVLVFITVQFFIRGEKEIIRFSKILILAISVSAFFAIMQFLNIELFFDISDAVNPAFPPFSSWLRGNMMPGLAFFSISLSYHVITFGGFVWAILYLGEGYQAENLRNAFMFLLTSILLAAVLITFSRSAILAVIFSICILFCFGMLSGYKRFFQRKRVYVITIVLFLMLFSEFFLINWYHTKSGGTGRLFRLQDPLRMEAFRAAISALSGSALSGKNILIGPGMEAYTKAYREKYVIRTISPHNMLIDSLIRYGVVGYLLLLSFLFCVLRVCLAAVRSQHITSSMNWVIFGGVVGIFANAFNSLFHNDSYLFGTTTPWWILGLLCSVVEVSVKRATAESKSSC